MGLVALCLLLDVFPRAAFREVKRQFVYDVDAQRIVNAAVDSGLLLKVQHPVYALICLYPLMHSENVADQKLCRSLYKNLLTVSAGHPNGQFIGFQKGEFDLHWSTMKKY